MALRQPSRMGANNPELSAHQKFARFISGNPSDYVHPDFWSGLAKEATLGLAGLPGDLGFLIGGMAAPAVMEMRENFREGRPLTQGLLQHVGDPTDYHYTSDRIAKDAGIPFKNTPQEMRGRFYGGLFDVLALANALRLQRNFFDPDVEVSDPTRQGGAVAIAGKPKTENRLPRGMGQKLKEAKAELRSANEEFKIFANRRKKNPDAPVGRAEQAAKNRLSSARKNVAAIQRLRETKTTVANPQRVAYPGVYKDAVELAREAEKRVEPEDPALKELFGVTRADLFDIQQERGVGPVSSLINRPQKSRGSEAARNVMNPENEARLIENLATARTEAPRLFSSMAPWYVMDPAFNRMLELLGPDEAQRLYVQMNTLTGMASPGSDVLTEIRRGTAASKLAEEGRFDEFVQLAGVPFHKRKNYPDDLAQVPGHMYHSTAHAKPMQEFLNTGEIVTDAVKVPSYIEASGIPNVEGIPFQSGTPVGDAHFIRSLGLADTRTSKDFAKSISGPELRTIEDWWSNIARSQGLEPVPAQAVNWGLYSPQTGVETMIGAGKLELLSKRITERAAQLGMSPQELRDLVLTGKEFATMTPLVAGGLLGAEQLYQPESI